MGNVYFAFTRIRFPGCPSFRDITVRHGRRRIDKKYSKEGAHAADLGGFQRRSQAYAVENDLSSGQLAISTVAEISRVEESSGRDRSVRT